nr:FCD domain-containing protein [Virgibacillus sp. NKC19-16]
MYLPEEKLNSLSQCIKFGREGTTEEVMKANEHFHELIVQASGNSEIIDIINHMKSIIYLFRKTVVLHMRPFLIDEHEEKRLKTEMGRQLSN